MARSYWSTLYPHRRHRAFRRRRIPDPLLDRSKDVIISGGFNIYPSDIEAELSRHEAVLEAAIIGVASEKWGETPVAFVVQKPDYLERPEALKEWVNARVGKTQRLADLVLIDTLPRSSIGKILKRELRDQYAGRFSLPSTDFTSR